MYPVRRQISPHASRLRRNATNVERTLWQALRNRQLEGFKFRRQATVGPYIVDFLCIEAKLIVELDGGQHSDDADRLRTDFLKSQGLSMLRFWNHDVVENFDGVAESIRLALLQKTLTQPSPVNTGEG